MTAARISGLLALIAAAIGLVACGNSDSGGLTKNGGAALTVRPVPTIAAAPAVSPAEQAAAAKRSKLEQPKFSPAGVTTKITRLPLDKRRAALLVQLRHSVRFDALAHVKRHDIRGPILDVSCDITRDDKEYADDHHDAPVLRYDCLAINFRGKTKPPMVLGSQFEARVDFDHVRYAWCLFTPVGGEGTHSATTLQVVPSPACVAPPGDG